MLATTATHAADYDRELLRATLRLNATLFGIVLGLLGGLLLLAFALGLGALSEDERRFVAGLLSIFLPGYAPGWLGGLAGFWWGLVDGAVIGAGVYWLHGRTVLADLDERVRIEGERQELPRAVLQLSGPALGLATGIMGACGLLVTTNWLVLRGTAGESVHARLLGEILPGYAVSPLGSLVGAVELFAIVFVLAWVFAATYNRIARRGRRSAAPGA